MQIVPTIFNDYAQGDIRPHSWGIRISFDKVIDSSVTWFVLDQSLLDGPDLLQGNTDNPLQAWDLYEYKDYSDRIVSQSWSRELDFPYSVASARGDFILVNTDQYFTPNGPSPINDFILPKRPVRLLSGFNGILIPQFVGLTSGMPEIDEQSGTAVFTALDFLTQIYDLPIQETISAQNIRTDEVLEIIFTQYGLAPSQYNLLRGRNVIPFLFFEKKAISAGEVIRRLLEAEMGLLWLDEVGIIQFRPRLTQIETPVYDFDSTNIVSLTTSGDDNIINAVYINSDIRAVVEYQPIYDQSLVGSPFDVESSTSVDTFLQLEDPAVTATSPVNGEIAGTSWFTATDIDGNVVTSGVNITSSFLFTNTYKLTFQNTNLFPITISGMQIWGEPAKIVDRIRYENTDDASVSKYDIKSITIDNNFIQSISQCDSLALTILDAYSEYAGIITMEVKGNPALQLDDIITVDYRTYDGQYKITKLDNNLSQGKFTQVITAKSYKPREWFTLDVSLLDGTAVLAP